MLEPLEKRNFSSESSKAILNDLLSVMRKRKTTRDFSDEQFDIEIIMKAIEVAGTAPSGANKQPWTFAVIQDQETKKTLRRWAESEEAKFYEKNAPQQWLDDLKFLHTNQHKEFITTAPYIIPVFTRFYEIDENGEKTPNYYATESVGLATGLLIAALHLAGISTLTYTPSNRNQLTELLGRPKNEKTFMVIVAGLPKDLAKVPAMTKKTREQISLIYESVKPRNLNNVP